MLEVRLIKTIAAQLQDAQRSRRQIAQLSRDYPEMTVEDSYAIQRAWIAREIADGRRVIGHKIGLTSRAMQQAINIDEPDFGVLLDEMLMSDGARIEMATVTEPKVEAEIAFILADDLSGPDCSIFDVLNATAYVVPAIEILDARIQRIDPETGRTRTVLDTIADNAANCGIIVGGHPARPLGLDLRRQSVICHRNSLIEETGVAAGVLNHPANGVAWLANRLHGFGEQLRAGEIILSGSFIRPIPARQGDTFFADFGSFGTVSCQFM